MEGKGKNKKILISGGGIAGCTLAYFLKQYGFTPVVIDSAEKFKHAGYMLALNLQIGQEVAKKMGVLEILKPFEILLTRNIMFDMNEKLIMDVEATPKQHAENTGLMLNRADLHATLYNFVKNEIDFRFGEEIKSLEHQEKMVEVTFSSETKEEFELVIGADGVHSKVRKLIFGDGFENNIGTAYFAFIIPNRTTTVTPGKNDLIMIRGKDFLLAYHAIGENELGGYIFHSGDSLVSRSQEERRSFMISNYGKYNGAFSAILESLTDDDYIFHDSFTQIIMSQWYKDRVCLIGDAAHCPTPASGVGASMAMAGGYMLAKYLSENEEYTKAFSQYDSYLRPYILMTQKSAITSANLISGKSIIPYDVINAFLRIIPVSFITKFHSHKLEMPLP